MTEYHTQEQTVPNQRGIDGPTRQAPAETQDGWRWNMKDSVGPGVTQTQDTRKQSRAQVGLNLQRLDLGEAGGDPCLAAQHPCLSLSALAHSPAEPQTVPPSP